MILFGHQTGNPNAHHAAFAHYEAERLEAFVVPWFPSRGALTILHLCPLTRQMAARLERRRFEPLADAPKIQGRMGEFERLAKRALGRGDEGLSYEVNDWLMRTMAAGAKRASVTAVHSYEDACLWSFHEAKKLGKACIYDMPIGYYPAWERTQTMLSRTYADWLPKGGLRSTKWVRPQQKQLEMGLADLVLVPSNFAQTSITDFTDKKTALAAYGVDADFWHPSSEERNDGLLRFLYAGQISIRKGIPVLLEAWKHAGLNDAELELIGDWQLAEEKRRNLPLGVAHKPPCSPHQLRSRYQSADVFVFPSFFEGFGLVLLEAMACGLPIVSSERTVAPDLIDEENGVIVAAGELDAWIAALRSAADNQDRLPAMKKAARERAIQCTWKNYRDAVSAAVASYC